MGKIEQIKFDRAYVLSAVLKIAKVTKKNKDNYLRLLFFTSQPKKNQMNNRLDLVP